jgi:CRISPR/Cas system CSM-associated protein Csm2 small subunit
MTGAKRRGVLRTSVFVGLGLIIVKGLARSRRFKANETVTAQESHSTRVSPVRSTVKEPRRKRKPSAYLSIAILISAAIVSAVAGTTQSRRFFDFSSTPVAPEQKGSIAVFFADPKLDVDLVYYVGRSGRFSISSMMMADERSTSSFLAVYSGPSGYLQSFFGSSNPSRTSKKEIQSVLGLDGKQIATRWAGYNGIEALHRPPPQEFPSTFFIDNYEDESAAITSGIGTVAPNGSVSSADDFVHGELPSIVATTPGKEAGAVPPLATPMKIKESSAYWRGYQSRKIGGIIVGGRTWYPPARARIDTMVNYADINRSGVDDSEWVSASTVRDPSRETFPIPAGYQILRAYPATVDDSQLRWTQDQVSRVNWLVQNEDAENRASYSLFLAGIFLGASFGFLASALERTIDVVMG